MLFWYFNWTLFDGNVVTQYWELFYWNNPLVISWPCLLTVSSLGSLLCLRVWYSLLANNAHHMLELHVCTQMQSVFQTLHEHLPRAFWFECWNAKQISVGQPRTSVSVVFMSLGILWSCRSSLGSRATSSIFIFIIKRGWVSSSLCATVHIWQCRWMARGGHSSSSHGLPGDSSTAVLALLLQPS